MRNVLLILTDQQRKDSLGCYGNPIVSTPNLDRLAREGIRFERAYVANPICMPDRMSLFTGMYPRNHGLWTNGLLLSEERCTLATILRDYGYETASFGKMHFTPYGGEAGNVESAEYWKAKERYQAAIDANTGLFKPLRSYFGFDHAELTIGHTAPLKTAPSL